MIIYAAKPKAARHPEVRRNTVRRNTVLATITGQKNIKERIMRPKINIITLGVRDFHASLKFYKDGLGWSTSSASNDNIAFFPLGGIVLALYPRQALADDAKLNSEGTGFSAITLAYNAKSFDEVNEVMQLVEKLGAKIVKKPENVFWGGYSGYFADPDGHLWEVAYNPHFGFDDNENLVLPYGNVTHGTLPNNRLNGRT